MKPRIFIVDEPNHCHSLEVVFTAQGYDVDLAYNGYAALFQLKQLQYDAIVIDMGLPDIAGNELTTHVSKHCPGTAIIILIGNASLETAVEALHCDVYDYLRKPCDPDVVLRTVARGIEHHRLKQELANSEKRFRQLFQATWEGLLIYDHGKLLEANNQICEMFGYSIEELGDGPIFDLLLDRESLRLLHMQPGNDTIGPFEGQGRKKDGTFFPVELRIRHIDYADRQVQVAAIRDVSVGKKALEQQAKLREKLMEAKRTEALGVMASSVAHDLNNIMAALIAFPDLLLLDTDSDFNHREELEMIRDAGKRAAAVVNDLLTVTRCANCKKEPHNLNQLITSYWNSLEFKEVTKRFPGVDVATSLDGTLKNTKCSAVHLLKVIINLVNNAAEALAGTGKISLATRNQSVTTAIHGYETVEPGEYVILSVSDNGPGIPEHDLQQIFTPFYSKKNMGRSGTGLGLAVVWNTIHAHQGFIDIETGKNGSSFHLYLPATPEQVTSSKPELLSVHPYMGNGQSVLVVDDQENQREIAKRLLSKLGYLPHTVKSGEEAITFISTQSVALVVLDMIMDAGINGCETYEQLIRVKPGLPAIITSGYSDTEHIEKAKKLGIRQFITKPYSLKELGQAVKLEIH
ncbi:MAG: hypothetical protein CSA34_00080 [Desulfobulbus propionicus]|nr:MAG: hypothetical protein CSA34_00080 [Desulfobulbus propionicus]